MSADPTILVNTSYLEGLSNELGQAHRSLGSLAEARRPTSLTESPKLVDAYATFIADWSDKRGEITEALKQAADSIAEISKGFTDTDAQLMATLTERKTSS